MIHSNAELARAIRNRSSEYTIDEIFSSRYLSSYISGVITAMCEDLPRHPYLTVEYDVGSNETAYTDGNRIYCNSASPLIRELETPYKMFVSLFGHCSHETGHTLYTDFVNLNPLRQNWVIGEFNYYPKMPEAKGAKEFKEYLNTHPVYRALYAESMCNLVNVLEDVYIENMIRTVFSGLATVGLQVCNDEKYRLFPYEEDLFQQVLDNKTTPLDIAVWLIQMTKLGYTTKSNGKITHDQKVVKDFIYMYIDDIKDEINELCWESNGNKRAKLFNEIFVKLQDLLPRPLADQDYQCMPSGQGQSSSTQEDGDSSQEGQSSGDSSENKSSSNNKGSSGENKEEKKNEQSSKSSSDSSDRDLTEEEKEKLSKNSSENSQKAGMTTEAKGDSSSIASGNPDKEKAEAEKQAAKDTASSNKALEDLFDDMKKGLAEEETLSKDEAEHLKQLEEEAKDINSHSKRVENARFSGYKIDRDSYITAINNKDLYDSIYSEVSSASKSLARKINNILKDDADIEEYETGYMFGAKLSTRDLYRQDGKCFARLNTPGETKRLCISLLIDESGSMGGYKAEKARKAAILLEDALRRINIPTLIVGHTASSGDVILKVYAEPETRDGRDKYRLANITAYAGNIDGAAIKYMKEKMLKRPEEVKVLIVISDGLPAGVSFYSNNDQREDTRLAIKDARKSGIRVFGAILEDFEDISSLYDPNFCFDCTDLQGHMLEKSLCQLVKKYVLINQN